MYARCSIAYCCLSASVWRSSDPTVSASFLSVSRRSLSISPYVVLDLLELVVPVRSPLGVHVDDFVHIGFLDRVDDARELLGIVAAQGDFHHLRARDELDFQVLLEPRDRIDLLRTMRYVLTSLSWSAAFSTSWLLTRVTGYSGSACNLHRVASVSTVWNRTLGGLGDDLQPGLGLELRGGNQEPGRRTADPGREDGHAQGQHCRRRRALRMLIGLSVAAAAGFANPGRDTGTTRRDIQRSRRDDGRRVRCGAGQFTVGMRFLVHDRVFPRIRLTGR